MEDKRMEIEQLEEVTGGVDYTNEKAEGAIKARRVYLKNMKCKKCGHQGIYAYLNLSGKAIAYYCDECKSTY